MGLAGVSRSEVSFFGSDLWRLLSSETVLPSDLILSCCSRWVWKIYSPLPRRKMGKCFLVPRNSRILIPLRDSLRRDPPFSFSPLTALIFHYTLPPPSSLTPLFKPWWNGMEREQRVRRKKIPRQICTLILHHPSSFNPCSKEMETRLIDRDERKL